MFGSQLRDCAKILRLFNHCINCHSLSQCIFNWIHNFYLKTWIQNGWRTSQPRNFQPQASTPDLSTPDFSTMNFSTPWFKKSWLQSPGLKSSWFKSLGLKGQELKLGVEKSGVEMSFNHLMYTVNDYRTIIGWFIRKSFVIIVYRKILIELKGLSCSIFK